MWRIRASPAAPEPRAALAYIGPDAGEVIGLVDLDPADARPLRRGGPSSPPHSRTTMSGRAARVDSVVARRSGRSPTWARKWESAVPGPDREADDVGARREPGRTSRRIGREKTRGPAWTGNAAARARDAIVAATTPAFRLVAVFAFGLARVVRLAPMPGRLTRPWLICRRRGCAGGSTASQTPQNCHPGRRGASAARRSGIPLRQSRRGDPGHPLRGFRDDNHFEF